MTEEIIIRLCVALAMCWMLIKSAHYIIQLFKDRQNKDAFADFDQKVEQMAREMGGNSRKMQTHETPLKIKNNMVNNLIKELQWGDGPALFELKNWWQERWEDVFKKSMTLNDIHLSGMVKNFLHTFAKKIDESDLTYQEFCLWLEKYLFFVLLDEAIMKERGPLKEYFMQVQSYTKDEMKGALCFLRLQIRHANAEEYLLLLSGEKKEEINSDLILGLVAFDFADNLPSLFKSMAQNFRELSHIYRQGAGHKEQGLNKDQKEKLQRAYQTLGLSTQADEKKVKKVFKQLAMKYHPDRRLDQNQSSDHSTFLRLREAYELILESEQFFKKEKEELRMELKTRGLVR